MSKLNRELNRLYKVLENAYVNTDCLVVTFFDNDFAVWHKDELFNGTDDCNDLERADFLNYVHDEFPDV